MFFLLLNKNISYGYSFEAGIILAQNIMGENILFSQNKIIEFILWITQEPVYNTVHYTTYLDSV